MRNPLPPSSKQSAREGENGDGSSSGNKKARTACCSKVGLKRGPWTAEEDELLSNYVKKEGEGKWRTMPNKAGLLRCGKSCRLRWMNYLRPSVKRGDISTDEEDLILRLHRLLGNRWSLIAGRIPGRTDNEIKNYWNTHLSKKLISQGIDPKTHKPLLNPINNKYNIIGNKQDYSPNSSSDISKNTVLGIDTQYGGADYCVKHVDGSKDQMVIESNKEDDFDMDFFMPDEAFSSFLNSLINDEMFKNNTSQQVEE